MKWFRVGRLLTLMVMASVLACLKGQPSGTTPSAEEVAASPPQKQVQTRPEIETGKEDGWPSAPDIKRATAHQSLPVMISDLTPSGWGIFE
jgi:hypothetical protein